MNVINADLLSTLASFQALITPQISLKPSFTSPVEEDEKKPLPLQRNGISQSTIEFWRAETKKMAEEKDKVEKPPVRRTYAAKRKYPDYTEKEMQQLLLRLRGTAPIEYDPQEGSSTSSSTQSPQPVSKTIGVQAVPPVQATPVQAVQAAEPNQAYQDTLKGLMAHPSLKSVLLEPTNPANVEILKNIELNAKAHDEKLRKLQELPPKYSKFDGICLAYLYGVYQSLTAEDTDRFGPFDFGPLGVWIKKMVDLHLEIVAIEERKSKVALHPDKLQKLDEKTLSRVEFYKNLLGAPFADHVQNVQWVLMHKTAIKVGRLEVNNTSETVMAVKNKKGGIHPISFPKPSQVVGTCDTEQLNQLMEFYKKNMQQGDLHYSNGPKPAKRTKMTEATVASGMKSESSGLPTSTAAATTVAEMNGIWMNGGEGGGFPIPATSSTASSSASVSGLNWNGSLTAEQVAMLLNNLPALVTLLKPQGNITAPNSSSASLPPSSNAPLLQAALLNANSTVSAPSIVPAPVPYVPSTVESIPISFASTIPQVSIANFFQASTPLPPLQIDFNQLAAASVFTSPPVQSTSSAFLGVNGNGAMPIEDQGNQNQASTSSSNPTVTMPEHIMNSPLLLHFRQNQSAQSASTSSFLSPTLPVNFQPQIIPVHAPRAVFPTSGRPNASLPFQGVGCETAPISPYFYASIDPSSSFYSQETVDTTNTTPTSVHSSVFSSSIALECSNSVIQDAWKMASSPKPAILTSGFMPPACSRRSIEFSDASDSSVSYVVFQKPASSNGLEPESRNSDVQEPEAEASSSSDFSSVQPVLQLTSHVSQAEEPVEPAPIAEPIEDNIENSTCQPTFVAYSEETPLLCSSTASSGPIEFSDASSSETVVCQPDSPVAQVVKQEPDCSEDFEPEFQNSEFLNTETGGLTNSSSCQATEFICHESPVAVETIPQPRASLAEPVQDNLDDSRSQLSLVVPKEETVVQTSETSINSPVVVQNNSIDHRDLDCALQNIRSEEISATSPSARFEDSEPIPSNSGLQATSTDDDWELTNREMKVENHHEEEEEIPSTDSPVQEIELKIEISPPASSEVSLQCSTSSNSPITDQPTPPSTTTVLFENGNPGPVFKFPSVEDTAELPNPVQELLAQLEEGTNRKDQLHIRIDVLQKELLPISLQYSEKVNLCADITKEIETNKNLTPMEIDEYERVRRVLRDGYAPLSAEIGRRQAVLWPLEKEKEQTVLNLKSIREQLRKHGLDFPEPIEKEEEIEEDEEEIDPIPEPPSSIPSYPLHDSASATIHIPPEIETSEDPNQSCPVPAEPTQQSEEATPSLLNVKRRQKKCKPENPAEMASDFSQALHHATPQGPSSEEPSGAPAEETVPSSRGQEEKTPLSSFVRQGGMMKLKFTTAILREATEKTKIFLATRRKEEEENRKIKEKEEARKLQKRRRTDADSSSQDVPQRSNRAKRVRKSFS